MHHQLTYTLATRPSPSDSCWSHSDQVRRCSLPGRVCAKVGRDGIDYRKFFYLYGLTEAQERERYAVLIDYRWEESKPGSEVQVLQAARVILERIATEGLVKRTHFMIHDVHNVVVFREVLHPEWIID